MHRYALLKTALNRDSKNDADFIQMTDYVLVCYPINKT